MISLSVHFKKILPDLPPAGTGNLTLVDLCSQYNLNIKVILRGLSKENIEASANLTLKKIAEENQIGPWWTSLP